MTIRLAPVLLVLGLVFGVFGAVMGLTTISRQGVTCGSAFRPNTNAPEVADLTNAMEADATGTRLTQLSAVSDACSAARSDRKPIALATLIPGAVVLLAGVGMGARDLQGRRSRTEPAAGGQIS